MYMCGPVQTVLSLNFFIFLVFNFILEVVLICSHTEKCSTLTSGSVFRDYSWQYIGNIFGARDHCHA